MFKNSHLYPNRYVYLSVLIAVCTYFWVYFDFHSSPGLTKGNSLGWWGWSDQKAYFRSLRAFNGWNFSASNHVYPVLYPLLGSFFFDVTNQQPFFLVNLSSLIIYIIVFIRLSNLYVSQISSVFLILFSLILNYDIFLQFVIPWTTTLVAAFFAIGILGLAKQKERYIAGSPIPLGVIPMVLITFCLGLVATTRPVDSVVASVFWLGLIYGQLKLFKNSSEGLKNKEFLLKTILPSSASFATGPVIFLVANKVIYGEYLSHYFRQSSSVGINFLDLPEKFFSIWLDSVPLYLESGLALIDHYPWLLLSLLGMVFFLIFGDWVQKTIIFAILTYFALYLSYNDLFPNGVWRYFNIHYFKWVFPYLALFALLFLVSWIKEFGLNKKKASYYLLASIISIILILSIQIKTSFQAIPLEQFSVDKHRSWKKNVFHFDKPRIIDFIDIEGVKGKFHHVYLGKHLVSVNNKKLIILKDFKVLPAKWGIRVLFTRPVAAMSVSIQLHKKIRYKSLLKARIGTYTFGLGMPKFLINQAAPIHLFDEFPITITSDKDIGMVSYRGFSKPEKWGRWTVGKTANLDFNFTAPKKIIVRISGFSFSSNEKLFFKFRCGIRIKKQIISNKSMRIDIPCEFTDNKQSLEILVPNPRSPKELGMGKDERKLGLAILNIKIDNMP
ncbi:MAG: hypothetical protein QNL04_15560 [SAR324 cluster bacterium]|nr:hypothetical protein [SAR324 cluster bacterium]